jgi:hypothetical protein
MRTLNLCCISYYYLLSAHHRSFPLVSPSPSAATLAANSITYSISLSKSRLLASVPGAHQESFVDNDSEDLTESYIIAQYSTSTVQYSILVILWS